MKRYDRYKDSGIDWIGEIPEEWEISRVKYYGLINSGINISGDKISDDGEYPIWGGNGLMGYTNSYNVEKNAIVIGRVGALCGNVRLVDSKIYVTDNALILSVISIINVEYLYYVLDVVNLNKLNTSSAQPLITGTKVKNVNIPIPSLQEQKEIVSYIKDRTLKIDLMVEKYEKKIELLEELKQSVISTAVTRGINPNVEMKDSGIDWIGEIPMNWRISRVKYYGLINSGVNISGDKISDDGEYPIWGGNGLMGYTNSYNVEKNAIVIGRVGALCGNVRLVNSKIYVTDNALILSITSIINVEYLYYVLNIVNLNKLNTSSAQPLITGTKVKNVRIPIPSLQEQKEIVSYIEAKTAMIDSQIEKQRKQIVLLKELKQTIISEAVTGKIKVA